MYGLLYLPLVLGRYGMQRVHLTVDKEGLDCTVQYFKNSLRLPQFNGLIVVSHDKIPTYR
jgi:hypothetical protein